MNIVSEPFFIDGPAGRLFAVHHRPAEAGLTQGQVLLAPPFNEEMNRCRSMITLQAHALAAIGLGTLVLDLHGTGDSAGDFASARWALWLDSLRAGRQWLDEQPGGCRALWGLRLGAILASQLHAEWADPTLALVLWQPVADGKTHLTQFMRVRIAANLDRTDVAKETTTSMRRSLASGEILEVAGYEIHPALAEAVDGARLEQHRLVDGSQVLWLENAVGAPPGPTPASEALLARWPGESCQTDLRLFQGPAFWQVHERTLAHEAVRCTTDWFARRNATTAGTR